MKDELVVPAEIRTERLMLRMPSPDDALEVYEAVVESLPELRPWLVWAHQEQSVEQTRINIETARELFLSKTNLRYYMFDVSSGRLVGSTVLHEIDWEIPKFEIGYWVRTSAAGRGYALEAVRGLTELAFSKLNARRVEIRCDERNTKSRSVAEKAGYTLEGILRNDTLSPDGDLRSTAVYSRIDWGTCG